MLLPRSAFGRRIAASLSLQHRRGWDHRGCHGSHSASSCSVATASGENYSDGVSFITSLKKITKLLKCLCYYFSRWYNHLNCQQSKSQKTVLKRRSFALLTLVKDARANRRTITHVIVWSYGLRLWAGMFDVGTECTGTADKGAHVTLVSFRLTIVFVCSNRSV